MRQNYTLNFLCVSWSCLSVTLGSGAGQALNRQCSIYRAFHNEVIRLPQPYCTTVFICSVCEPFQKALGLGNPKSSYVLTSEQRIAPCRSRVCLKVACDITHVLIGGFNGSIGFLNIWIRGPPAVYRVSEWPGQKAQKGGSKIPAHVYYNSQKYFGAIDKNWTSSNRFALGGLFESRCASAWNARTGWRWRMVVGAIL